MKLLAKITASTLLAAAIAFVPSALAQRGPVPGQTPTVTPPTPAPSSAPQEVGEDDVVRVDTDLVTLTATVTDNRGCYRADLRQSDFAVYEDGVRRELAYFNTGDRVPVSLGIIFDTSGSMVDKMDGVQDAVEHFVKSVAPGDEIFLVRFSDEVDLVQDFTEHRQVREECSLSGAQRRQIYRAPFFSQAKSGGKNSAQAVLQSKAIWRDVHCADPYGRNRPSASSSQQEEARKETGNRPPAYVVCDDKIAVPINRAVVERIVIRIR